LEDILAGSYKTKHILITRSSSCAPWCLPKWVEKLLLHENLHMNVYSSFIYSWQKLEATMPFCDG
jgi:hypothetical protein